VPGFFIIPQAQTCLQACGIIKKTNCVAAGFGLVSSLLSGCVRRAPVDYCGMKGLLDGIVVIL